MKMENDFIKVAPEEVGIPSSAVLRFVERLEKKKLPMHSVLMARSGKIMAEGYYRPFHKDKFQRMYSISKSFVSIAIGLMADEGLISINDRIADYFPELLPDEVHPYISDMTIRDLLMMATPFNENNYVEKDEDWLWTFFNKAPSHPPGTIFSYNTAATVALNALVEKLSGMPFLDYMRPRLLDPIGFSKDAWCIKRPEGGSWGGSGVLCTSRDLLRFALVLLNKGRWGDKQLISEEYVNEATSRQIDNRVSARRAETQFGYGYQIWRVRNNGFALLGMGSQMAVCFPDKDFVLVTTCDSQSYDMGYSNILDALWEEIFPHLDNEPLEDNPHDYNKLEEKLSSLELPSLEGSLKSPLSKDLDGKIYSLNENPMEISQVSFNFKDDLGQMKYKNASGDHTINFAFGSYLEGIFPQKNYYHKQIGRVPNIGYDCIASAAWADDNTLIIYVYIVDNYLGTLKINLSFKDDEIALYMTKAAEWFLEEYEGFAGGIQI